MSRPSAEGDRKEIQRGGFLRVIHRAGDKAVHGGGDVRGAFEVAVAGPNFIDHNRNRPLPKP
jgi:hypothetical protein